MAASSPILGIFGLMRRRKAWRNPWRKRSRPWLLPGYLVLIFGAHVLAMMALEGMPPIDAVWLTATTIVTVGYGDLSAETVGGRLATMLLLYVGAIFVVAIAVNNWLDARSEKVGRKAQGAWRWNLQNHVVIIGAPERDASQFFIRLARQIRQARGWADVPLQLLTPCYEGGSLPQGLRDLAVVHYAGRGSAQADLEACGIDRARGVIILAGSETDQTSDARTFDLVDRVRETGYKGPIVAECVEDGNRPRLVRAGATSVVRPMRGFPEILTRALFAPGAEQVIESLFTAEGDECLLIDLPAVWRSKWSDIVGSIVREDIGMPIACRTASGEIFSNPPGSAMVEAKSLYVIVHDKNEARARTAIVNLSTRVDG